MNRLALPLLSITLFGCQYEGDGEYRSEGTWPFSTYSVELPAFPLVNGNQITYSLAGFNSHTHTLIELNVSSPKAIPFHKLELVMEMEITDTNGDRYFYRNGSLNAHYTRMLAQNETLWALDTEWNARYQYGDSTIDDRAVPFSTQKEPIELNSLGYQHLVPLESRDLVANILVVDVPPSLEGLKGEVRLVSSWK